MQEKQATSSRGGGATTDVFTELRAAAAALVAAHPEVVRVDAAAIDRLTSTLAGQDVKAAAERVGLPLKFANALEVCVGARCGWMMHMRHAAFK